MQVVERSRLGLLALLALLIVGGGYGAGWKSDYRSRVVNGLHYIADVGAGIVTLFDAPLNTNGLTAADPASSWPVTGVTAAGSVHWSDDPDGASGETTEAWTAGGTPATFDSPFCSDGSHSDVTSGCLTGRRYDGTNENYTSDTASIWSPASADFTACSLFRSFADAGFLAANREGAAGEGWSMSLAAGAFTFTVENHAAAESSVVFNTRDPGVGAWELCCGTYDHDGNLSAYCGGVADPTTTASSGGVVAPSTSATIGEDSAGGSDLAADVVVTPFWPSLLDSTDMQELFEYFAGILDTQGAPAAFTSTGPNCCWIDGEIECFSDDWPMIGCELPPGVTGAGTPSSGFYSGEALTNSVLYSRDLDSWAKTGTPVIAATSTDLFRDGRQTQKVTDDDAAGVEGIRQNFAAHGLSNGDDVQFCVFAKGAASSQKIDLRFAESGGVCAGGATNYDQAAHTVTTSWAPYEWTHTVVDETCVNFNLYMSVGDYGVAADTDSVEFVVQIFFDQDWCPPTYTETEAAAVGAGDDLNLHDISGVASLADVADGTIVSIDFTPKAATSTGGYLFEIADSATATDYYRAYWHTDEKLYLVGQSAAEGGEKAMYTSTSAWSPTAGTTYTLAFTISGAASTVSIDGVDEAGANVTLTNAPDSLDNLATCTLDAGTDQVNGFCENVTGTK